ncbi:unnamed protein product [Phaedon cochleariae]|uniref:RING-type E3 ubiquitin transferase n=1 Tax=Phaedon cochleariae TaxID=80249 RepID=A0A9P0DWR7_PHACE|nr:unnamed protein product [Phaedon cochleariae]
MLETSSRYPERYPTTLLLKTQLHTYIFMDDDHFLQIETTCESIRMTYVQPESLSKLSCCKCKKYLSHFPISTSPDGSTCGRCQPLDGAVHNEVYEYLAEKQKFPCSHNSNGCLENLFPKNIPKHERFCNYQKVNCPTIITPTCQWKGFTNDLLQHFEEKHPTFLLSEGNFEVDFINSHKENYLLPYGESLYIVNRSNDSRTGTFSCTVTYIGSDPVVDEYSYKIILKSGSGIQTHEISKKLGDVTDINNNMISSILNDPVSIVARIEVFKEDPTVEADVEEVDNTIQWDFLRELECLVCMEYMVPPIFQCLTGHSICKGCKEKMKECPTCKNEIGNTQNFALAQLVSFIDYPCKHDRCKFKAKPAEIKRHEASCVFGTIGCPLKDSLECEAQMTQAEVYDHVTKEHYENLLEFDMVSEPFEEGESVEECYVVPFDGKLFKLCYSYDDEVLMWVMQFIGPAEASSEYCFDIDIIDTSGTGNRAYFKAACEPLNSIEEGIRFHYHDVASLITTELRYRVHVSKYKD